MDPFFLRKGYKEIKEDHSMQEKIYTYKVKGFSSGKNYGKETLWFLKIIFEGGCSFLVLRGWGESLWRDLPK